MPIRPVAVFCMPDRGHFQRLRALIAGLSQRGAVTYVLSGARFRSEIERAGGIFVDLFSKYPVRGVDDESWPEPVRFVTYAARHADAIARDLQARGVSLVVHDTFAVVGTAVANVMGIPHVNVCAGHNVVPSTFVRILESHPRVVVSAACREAVSLLRARYGIADASPFSYVTALSPYLNLYCEPPEFLPEADRRPFEPLEFFGSLLSAESFGPGAPDVGQTSYFRQGPGAGVKAYVSFGTVIWDYRRAEALAALTTIARALTRAGQCDVVVGLGGADLGDAARATLMDTGAAVVTYVDQWRVLQQADIFVTHHGLNSTHEAIAHGVPMLSYPFVWDQPGLAATCQRIGVALPLVEEPMAPLGIAHVDAALAAWQANRSAMADALAAAQAWEKAVIARRPAIFDRLLALAEKPGYVRSV